MIELDSGRDKGQTNVILIVTLLILASGFVLFVSYKTFRGERYNQNAFKYIPELDTGSEWNKSPKEVTNYTSNELREMGIQGHDFMDVLAILRTTGGDTVTLDPATVDSSESMSELYEYMHNGGRPRIFDGGVAVASGVIPSADRSHRYYGYEEGVWIVRWKRGNVMGVVASSDKGTVESYVKKMDSLIKKNKIEWYEFWKWI